MPTNQKIFVITASNPEACEHVDLSIANSIQPALCVDHFAFEVLTQAKEKSGDGQLYAWGAVPGEKNTKNWESMNPGDLVLVYQGGEYTYWGRIISKHRNV